MIASKLLERTWRAYRGKGTSKTPVWGSEKANMVLDIANQKTEEWATDTDREWKSLFRTTPPIEPGTVATSGTSLTGTNTYFSDYESGDKILVDGETVRVIDEITSDTALTVTVAFTNTDTGLTFTRTPVIKAGLQEYTLHRSFIVPSDEVIVETSTQDITYKARKPKDRKNADVFFSGSEPQKITFYENIESTDQAVGGELKVAGYYMPNELVNSTDTVKVDNPNWLVLATAAELARNDAAKEDQFPNLSGMANQLYVQMIKTNENIGFKQDNTVPYDMPMIGEKVTDGEL